MVASILKTTEIDIIWFMIYFGMFTGLFTILILSYEMYQDYKRKK